MTACLLDSHVLLWFLSSPERLGDSCRRMLGAASQVRFSAASIWELQIKSELGKLSIPECLAAAAVGSGLAELPVTARHAEATAALVLPHRDPFDRMLIAQAATERLTFLTADKVLLCAGFKFVVDAAR